MVVHRETVAYGSPSPNPLACASYIGLVLVSGMSCLRTTVRAVDRRRGKWQPQSLNLYNVPHTVRSILTTRCPPVFVL